MPSKISILSSAKNALLESAKILENKYSELVKLLQKIK
jgi:hypothetical protein